VETLNGPNGWYNAFSAANGQYTPPVMQAFYESNNLSNTLEVLARSMSNTIRAADDSTAQTGVPQVMTTFYHIRWPWITLHAILVVAGAVFLAITILETRSSGVPAWKSNSLALLSQKNEIGDVFTGVESLNVMEEKARKYNVLFF
jgi:hypothetical protein